MVEADEAAHGSTPSASQLDLSVMRPCYFPCSSTMATLKASTNLKLAVVLVLNFGLFSLLARGASLSTVLQGAGVRDLQDLIPAALSAILTGIITAQVSGDMKARFALWRWSDALPGCRAFTVLGPRDTRVDMAALRHLYGPLPTWPQEQNALWFKLYRTVASEASVLDAHSDYLFFRDYAFLMIVLIALVGFLPIITPIGVYSALLFGVVAIVQYALAARAAQVRGERLVCNVLAISSAETSL